jgi:diguanylate cyclase (GGDEF)-like protein
MHTPRAVAPFVLFVITAISTTALARETGYPVITVLRQEDHGAGSQTFDVAADARGRLLFGNLEGVLIHDGAWWSRVDVPGGSAFKILPLDHERLIAVLLDDFGILGPGADGLLAYHSIAAQLPPEMRKGLAQVAACPAPGGAVFVTNFGAVRWDGRSMRVLTRFPNEQPWRRCFSDGEQIWISTALGLEEIGARTTFAGRRVDLVLDDFIIVRNEGLFHRDETPYPTAAASWLRGKTVMDGRRLSDGRVAVATLRDGLLILNNDGSIDQIIDAAAGLPEEYLYGVAEDHEGAIWLAMDSSIVRVDVSTQVSVLDRRVGLRGPIHDVTRHEGRIIAATSDGVFALDETPAGLRARQIEGVQFPWSLVSAHGDLLAGTYGGLYVIRGSSPPRLVEGSSDRLIYTMLQSRRDPSVVWLGMDEGLAKLTHTGNDWRFGSIVPQSTHYVRSLVEDAAGVLWTGSDTEGAMRVDPNGTLTRIGGGEVQVLAVAGRVVFLPKDGVFSQVRDGRLVPDPLLGHIHAATPFSYSGADARGNLWLGERPPRLLRRLPSGRYESEALALGTLQGDMETFFSEADGVLWMGSERGLYRIEPAALAAPAKPPAPLIHRVVAGNGRVLLDGNGTPRTGITLPHNFGRLRIEVSPLSYRPATNYQYRLDPIDPEWTSWTRQAFLDFTNLAPGDYTFRTRTRAGTGNVSGETAWPFTILPPWFATWWAMLLWATLAAAIVAAIVRLRTRVLQRRAEQLQSLVGQQTQRLEKLSFADPLTGVANRRYFDRALKEAWQDGQQLSLILLDLDHFKDINDSRGHIAGDECLRRVAEQLEGDVVCRWGGEEFAILLRDADERTAVTAAEDMRTRIAALGLTASFGVAARGKDDEPHTLVERADRSLYTAKRNGRNRVETIRIGDPSPARAG